MARNAAGQFAGTDDRGPSFDLVSSLKKLFALAERNGDFSGASTIARTLASLGEATVSQQTAAPKENLVPLCTYEEKVALHELVQAHGRWEMGVRTRLGKPPLRPPHLDTPPPVRSQFCDRCSTGVLRLWTATDERQVELLREYLGSDEEMQKFAEFLEAKEGGR